MQIIKIYILQLLILIGVVSIVMDAHAQDDLDLNKLIKPIDSVNIFKDERFYSWCSSVIKGEDGKYHMFYSRWPHGKRVL
ncbi:MAG TPA: hypothetical protein VL088_13545, partial [Pedobacter sp.]|nr:hypothetical protein [Pedobacter sp.]